MSGSWNDWEERAAGYHGYYTSKSLASPEHLLGQQERAQHEAMLRGGYAGSSALIGPRGLRALGLLFLAAAFAQLVVAAAVALVLALCTLPFLRLLARLDTTRRWAVRELVGPTTAAFVSFALIVCGFVVVLRANPTLLGDSVASQAVAHAAAVIGGTVSLDPLWWFPPDWTSKASQVSPVSTLPAIGGVLCLTIPATLVAAWVLKRQLRRVAKVPYRTALGGLLAAAMGGVALAGAIGLALARFAPPT